MEYIWSWIVKNFFSIIFPIFALLAYFMLAWNFSTLFVKYSRERRIPKSLNIAVIGDEKSGKTTLITTIFGEIFANRSFGLSALPSSIETIEKVNRDLDRIQNGAMVAPTKTQDIFAYSANIIVKLKNFSRTTKLIIGDFPGESSKQLGSALSDKLFQSQNFLDWCREADAFIFVVDLAKYLSAKNNYYRNNISNSIREAWQKILITNKNISDYSNSRPLVLIFNKADLFKITTERNKSQNRNYEVARLGFLEIPEITTISNSLLEEGINNTTKDFSELIAYLSNSTKNFRLIFVSSFANKEETEQRLNIDNILRFIFSKSEVLDTTGDNRAFALMYDVSRAMRKYLFKSRQ